MREFTLDDLRRIMRACAGEAEAGALDGDIADVPFPDLGYDSLAMLETVSRVEREFGTSIPDGAVAEITTPRIAVDYVNARLTAGV